jgi:hypothetical protein
LKAIELIVQAKGLSLRLHVPDLSLLNLLSGTRLQNITTQYIPTQQASLWQEYHRHSSSFSSKYTFKYFDDLGAF